MLVNKGQGRGGAGGPVWLAVWVGGGWIVHKISNLSYYILVRSPIFMDFSSFFRSQVQLDCAPAILSKRSDVVSTSVLTSGKSMEKINLREGESEKI